MHPVASKSVNAGIVPDVGPISATPTKLNIIDVRLRPTLKTKINSCLDRYNEPIPAFVLFQTQRFFISEYKPLVALRSSAIWRQSMQT